MAGNSPRSGPGKDKGCRGTFKPNRTRLGLGGVTTASVLLTKDRQAGQCDAVTMYTNCGSGKNPSPPLTSELSAQGAQCKRTSNQFSQIDISPLMPYRSPVNETIDTGETLSGSAMPSGICGTTDGAAEAVSPNPNPWVEYQPARYRDKEVYDIELRDGTIVLGCYPNGVHWNPMWSHVFGPTPKSAGNGPIADYRVVRIRRSHPDPLAE